MIFLEEGLVCERLTASVRLSRHHQTLLRRKYMRHFVFLPAVYGNDWSLGFTNSLSPNFGIFVNPTDE